MPAPAGQWFPATQMLEIRFAVESLKIEAPMDAHASFDAEVGDVPRILSYSTCNLCQD